MGQMGLVTLVSTHRNETFLNCEVYQSMCGDNFLAFFLAF